MITIRIHDARRCVLQDKLEHWQTFSPQDPPEPNDEGLGALANLHELRIAPRGGTAPRPQCEAESLTYVYQGALIQIDPGGGSSTLQAGEFQHTRPGRRSRSQEANASATQWVHFFQICLHAHLVDIEGGREQRRFSSAQRRNRLCLVASADGRQGSLRMDRDVLVLSGRLDPGHHAIHELGPARSVWVHILHGEATLGGSLLAQGDGACVTGESAVSLTARECTELLLIDVRTEHPGRNGRPS